MSLTSDPYAWLRSIYARLQSTPAFDDLVPPHQFERLAEAVAVDDPAQAAALREWPAAAQHALIANLAASDVECPANAVVSEFWRVTKGVRVLRCVAQYLSSGIDLRLLEGTGFRRTHLCQSASETEVLSQRWRTALLAKGWQLSD